VRHALGVEWGDRIVLESPISAVRLRVFPVTDDFIHRWANSYADKEVLPNQEVPSPKPNTDCDEPLSVDDHDTTVPAIHIDGHTRSKLGFSDKPGWGVYQPIRVYRDSSDYFLRLLNQVTIPIVAGLLSFVVVFEDFFSVYVMSALFILILSVIVISIIYEGRQNL
jgi:hypothetical protein